MTGEAFGITPRAFRAEVRGGALDGEPVSGLALDGPPAAVLIVDRHGRPFAQSPQGLDDLPTLLLLEQALGALRRSVDG